MPDIQTPFDFQWARDNFKELFAKVNKLTEDDYKNREEIKANIDERLQKLEGRVMEKVDDCIKMAKESNKKDNTFFQGVNKYLIIGLFTVLGWNGTMETINVSKSADPKADEKMAETIAKIVESIIKDKLKDIK